MAEYFDHSYSGYGHSYRGTEHSMEENALNQSMTRGSHQSQASGVSPSTKSWVASNQARPPPPPPEESATSSVVHNNVRPPRPLPTEPQFRQSRVPVKYEMAVEPEEYQHGGFTHMDIDPRDFPFRYPSEDVDRGAPDGSMNPSAPQMPIPSNQSRNRSFVGGFFKGLKKLPKMLRGGSKNDVRKLKRQGTFGTEGTSTTALGIERGNTLPRYLSNPSIGPSNPQFAHRLSMAGPSNTMPPSGAIPAEYHHRISPLYPQNHNAYPREDSVHIRINPAGPQHPIVTLTPPSDGVPVVEERADFYDGPTAEYPQRQLDDIMESESSRHGRATVMMYNTDSQAPTMNRTISRSSPTPGPRRSNTPGRVSYQQELPTRATVQAQSEPMPLPSILVPVAPMRGSGSTQPMMQLPDAYRSPRDTSRYTMTTLASHYDPSFASDLGPIEKFFKGLYNLPWVAERVTIDYRPADSDRARKKVKSGFKKPLSSWYRSVMTRSRHMSQNLDLLSAGTGSASGMSMSPETSPVSPHYSRRKHHSGQTKSSRRTRRDKTTSASTDAHQPRGPSPIIPGPYPYAYPAVYQYPYPYNAYIPVPQTAPRGPRTHHRHKKSKHHGQTAISGYPAYQPMAMPMAPPQPMQAPGAPVYFITPSPPQSNNGGNGDPAGQQAAQQFAQQYGSRPVQISPVVMQYVPGAYNPNAPNMISPPLTPQRHGQNAAT